MIRTRSIQFTLLLTISVLTLLLIIAISYFAHQAALTIINQEADKQYSQKVDDFSRQTDTYLKGYEKLLDLISNSRHVKEILKDHDIAGYQARSTDQTWQAVRKDLMLPVFQANRDAIRLLYFGSEKHGENYRQNDTTYKNKYDARIRKWYTTAREQNRLTYTNYPSANRKGIDVTISNPIHDAFGELLGVAGMDLITEQIFSGLSQEFLDSSSIAVVFDTVGTILFHPDKSVILKNLDDSTLNLGSSFVSMGKNMIAGGSGKAYFTDLTGEDYIAYFSPVGATGWVTGIAVKTAKLHEPTESLLTKIIIVDCIVLILVLIVSWFITRRMTFALRMIVANLKSIALGDTARHRQLTLSTNDEFGELAHWFNAFAEKYESLFEQLSQRGIQISELSGQLNNSIFQLNAAAIEQSTAVVETTSTMEEMHKSSLNISESSEGVLSAASRNQSAAKEGVELMRVFLKKMEDIDKLNQEKTHDILQMKKKVTRIHEVMGLIKGINEQTKLIAFNASLEASGAGEGGKRFAVVANEIRRLADTVQESMEEIRAMTDEIQTQTHLLIKGADESNQMVASGVQASRDVETHFNSIYAVAEMVTLNSRQITQATTQQRVASEQIVATLHDISAAINHVVSMASDVSHISQELEVISTDFKKLGSI
ncbi:MAG: methyl-accepting chemotaxis protein [Bacteroidetes bacterium]|nr:methyl-accepting chemotaxis protein [Bacteroidota bacterium]